MNGTDNPTNSPMTKHGDLVLVFGVIGILLVMIIPLPAIILDLLLAINITLSIVILLVVLYTLQPVDFSIFPSMLLVITMFRLSLNVASTRRILLYGHEGQSAAGGVIKGFAQVVIQGNYVVGFVIFAILMIIQFVVITKGAGRIAEVAARFTLDAMPMKQMAIDTDLNAGAITEDEARQKRIAVGSEANFYGAMDGASKFVRGDAIAGLIITGINIVGGLIIGVAQRGLPIGEALTNYTMLTIGDGLVSQLPSLIISTSSGLLISRSSERSNFGRALAAQFLVQPRALIISGGVLGALGLVPGMPTLPFLILSVATGGLGYIAIRSPQEVEELPTASDEEEPEEELSPIEEAEQHLDIDPVQLNVGYSLIQLVNPEEGGDLLNRIKEIRRTLAQELGFIIPNVRIRDQMDLSPGEYSVLVREMPVARGELRVNDFLAMEVGPVVEQIDGIPTEEPTNGQPALWISTDQRERAQMAGYLVIDPSSVLATHLIETLKRHADKFLTRQEVQKLIDRIKESNEVLVEEVVPTASLGVIQKILQNLLRESVPIRDLVVILEAIADNATSSKDVVLLTEAVRQKIGATICQVHLSPEGTLDYIALDESVEGQISGVIQENEMGGYQFLGLDPETAYNLVNSIANAVTQVTGVHAQPLIICSRSLVRAYLRQFLDLQMPTPIPVLSIEEVPTDVMLNEVGRIEI